MPLTPGEKKERECGALPILTVDDETKSHDEFLSEFDPHVRP